MRINKIIIKILTIALIIISAITTTLSLAVDTNSSTQLRLEYFRYVHGGYTNGYALKGSKNHVVFQIMSDENKTTYYCLNAKGGTTWNRVLGDEGHSAGGTADKVTYNKSYDLNNSEDITALRSATKQIYQNIGNSEYLNQILWILNNLYIPTENEDENLKQKQALLAKAGLIYTKPDAEGIDEDFKTYKYVPQNGFDYTDKLNEKTEFSNTWQSGYYYCDENGNFQAVGLEDELVEVVQQTAIWYYTNYKDPKSSPDEQFDVADLKLDLAFSNGTENKAEKDSWKSLSDNTFDVKGDGAGYRVGLWKREQAAILCSYLIDAADKYATEQAELHGDETPLSIALSENTVQEKTVGNSQYYVVGPITIQQRTNSIYELSNKITVNDKDDTGAYIADADGSTKTDQSVANYIGTPFYIAVPKYNVISSENITIKFNGTYKKNDKKLWTSDTAEEQPIVEVTPKTASFELSVSAPITKNFDLALRKAITKLVDSKGSAKIIQNEEDRIAAREITPVEEDILTNKTATYNHRKDPVVVKVGDKVTYQITIYNEGDIAGYASKIVDQLPTGLKSVTKTGEKVYSTKQNEYTVTYNEDTNKIELDITRSSAKNIPAFNGNTLESDTIELTCEVVEEAKKSVNENNYLTNIAYIAEEYNSSGVKVERDRNNTESSPTSSPTQGKEELNSTNADSYKGKSTNNSVYGDTTNSYYYQGNEDDDDFEKLVVKPSEFDLALQKYISNVYSNGVRKPGKQGPVINTQKLASGEAKTADYGKDTTKVKVKSGDYVTYTFTVYNEGDVDGKVNKITDNIPKGLQFVYPEASNDGRTLAVWNSDGTSQTMEVDEQTYALVRNNNASWSVNQDLDVATKEQYNGESTISVTCDVKSYLGSEGSNELKAYDSSKDINHDGKAGLSSVSVTLVLRVVQEDGKGVTIRNEAAITEAEDTLGNKQDATDDGLKDRDSQVNQWLGRDGEKKYQDDEDYDHIILAKIDLALTKFITAVSDDLNIDNGEYLTANGNEGSETNPYTRATAVNTSQLRNNPECHDAEYTMVKTPLTVPQESYVLYNIRVYNEGETDVYAGRITDHLPNYLDFIQCEFNTSRGWNVESDGKTVWTENLSHAKGTENLLKAFDKEKDDEAGSGLDYKDIQILCRVNSEAPTETELVNSAQISKYEDEYGNNITTDVDSQPNNLVDKNQKKTEQDDDDYEVVLVKKRKVDLALTKFIAAVSDDLNIDNGEYLTANGNEGSETNPYTRATAVNTANLKNDPECHDAEYYTVKDPIVVPAKSYVLYDIRVYNEGETDVYAGKVTDLLPDYLDFVECEFNTNYGWNVESDGKTIWTEHLSQQNGTENLLKAFDKINDNEAGSGLDYRDLQILCKVNDNAPTNKNLVNVAEVTEYEDDTGTTIPKDEDSTPDNVDEKNEDDDDYEQVVIKTFDLSLLKYVSTVYVTEDGETTTTETGNTGDDNTDIIPKVEVNRKKLDSTIVRFGYTIKITNEGDIAGYAKEITDYVPEGLKFYAEDNEGWTDEGNNVISTRLLENTLLQPGESATVTVILRWINGSENLGIKTNTAEISEDYNDEGVPDRDSEPDNRVPGEDDIDDASVLLAISTGAAIILTFVVTGLLIIGILVGGIILIKRFVL